MTSRNRSIFFTGIFILAILPAACIFSEQQDKISFPAKENGYDCYVNATENNDSVEVLFNYFKIESEKYTSLPKGVFLDGRALRSDSSRNMGIYYQAEFPLKGFTGPHLIQFMNAENKTITDSFLFLPFSLDTFFYEVSATDSLLLPLQGVEKGDEITVDINDSSFLNAGISYMDSAGRNKIVIREKEWKILGGGLQSLVLMRIRRYRHLTGQIAISYTIRREFSLKK
jgi:hypothetical protein